MKKHKITLEQLSKKYSEVDYPVFYEIIAKLIKKGELIPIKNSKTNGKKPALKNSYWYYEKEEDYSEYKEEIRFSLAPVLDTIYYESHPEQYVKDREKILLLSDYLKNREDGLSYPETVNERSFEIFGREKFIDREGGEKLFSHLNIADDLLNFYRTSEPMSYYSHDKRSPQIFLIIENKDTFYSMRRYLIESGKQILGMEVGTLIYGGGKNIWRTFEDYVNQVEPYFCHEKNRVYYFGDLDYEGIDIYERLVSTYPDTEILLFQKAYERMLKKAKEWGTGGKKLPKTKEGQKNKMSGSFLCQFREETQREILELLEQRCYIPQEILNVRDWDA